MFFKHVILSHSAFWKEDNSNVEGAGGGKRVLERHQKPEQYPYPWMIPRNYKQVFLAEKWKREHFQSLLRSGFVKKAFIFIEIRKSEMLH